MRDVAMWMLIFITKMHAISFKTFFDNQSHQGSPSLSATYKIMEW